MKDITVIQHETLKECFMELMDWDSINDEEIKYSYWLGHNGKRPFRENVKRWLENTKRKCWGWAEYKTKTIHIWINKECDTEEVIACLAHEAAHLRRPRFKDKEEEERKASRTELDAKFAYNCAIKILGNQ